MIKDMDCEGCTGLNPCKICGKCEHWLCSHCLKYHSCRALVGRKNDIQNHVRMLLGQEPILDFPDDEECSGK